MGFLLASAFGASAQAPDSGVIAGHVREAASLAPIAGASIHVRGSAGMTATDADGRFVTAAPVGRVTLEVRMIGFKPAAQTLTAIARDTLRIEISIEREAVVLGAVRSEARPPERDRFETRPNVGTITLTPRASADVPRVGEPDIARVIQLLPGVEARNDFSTGFNVRGGEADQNLVLMDGAPIYNPFHLGGLFSTFIDPAVGEVQLLTGGFPAEYGGRLSSVLDVRSSTESREGIHGTEEVSLLSATGHLASAFAGGRGNWMIAGRRTYADQIVPRVSRDKLPYHFLDFQGHASYELTPRTTVGVTAYDGVDVLDGTFAEFNDSTGTGASGGDFRFTWGNRVAGATVSHVLAPRPRLWILSLGDSASVEQHASDTQFNTVLDLGSGSLGLTNHVREDRVGGSLFTHTAGHDRTVGYDLSTYGIQYSVASASTGVDPFALNQHPTSGALYYDDLWRVSSRVLLDDGLRFESLTGRRWSAVSPRLSAKYFLSSNTAITAAVGRFSQWMHSLQREDTPVRLFDFWVSSDATNPVSSAWHYILGGERWLNENTSLRVEAFYKAYDRLLESNPQADPSLADLQLLTSNGASYGADVLLRRFETGPVSGWLSYTYTLSTRVRDSLRYYPGQDRRHELNAVVSWRLRLVSLGARLGIATGTPYTDIVGELVRRVYDPLTNQWGTGGAGYQLEFIGGPYNGARLPTSHRLDLSATRTFQWRGATLSPFLSVVNASDAKNVFIYVWDYSKAPPTKETISQFPFLPSLGVSVAF